MAAGFATGRAVRSRTQDKAMQDQEANDLYEMANLFPRTTGLSMTVWVSPRGRARHAPRIEVSLTPGRMHITQTAVVGIRPKPRLIEGKLSGPDFQAVSEWIDLNEDVLLDFWNETIDSVELGARLRKLSA